MAAATRCVRAAAACAHGVRVRHASIGFSRSAPVRLLTRGLRRLPAVSPHSYGAAAPPARSSARPAIAAAAAAALLGLLALALLSAGAQGGEDASALEQTAAQRQEVRDLLDQVMKEQGNVACAERGI